VQVRYVQRMVNLQKVDYEIVREYAAELGLGQKGFSAALRLILRDWAKRTNRSGGQQGKARQVNP